MIFNMDDWSQEIIDAKDRRVLPVLYFPSLSLSGKGIIETVHSGPAMAEAMAAIIKEYPAMIGAMTGMDLTVDTEAFGAKVTFKENEAPSIKVPPVETAEEAKALRVPAVSEGRVGVFCDAVKSAGETIPDRPIFGGLLGPFSLAATLMEVQKALKMVRKDPETLHLLLEKGTEFLIERAKAYKSAGASGVLLAEPTAGLLSPKHCEEMSSVYVKKLVDAVQDRDFFVILHNCGYVTKMVESMVGTGAKGYHFGNAVDMKEILPQTPSNVLVFGNIDPSRIFTNEDPETVRKVTLRLLEDMEPYPHFVLSSGCDIPPLAPKENIDAFFSACAEYNGKA